MSDPAGPSGRSTATAAIAIFVLALVVRLAYWNEIRTTALDRWHEWDQTDMATYLEQARRLPGDWLAAEPYHPYHAWQERWPPERWLEWYGPHAFHQAPAYSYALAVAGRLTGNALPWIKAAQLALGAGTCVLTLLIATRLAGLAVGCAAGILAALYGPLLYLEPQLLREGPALFFLLGIALLLIRHLAQPPAGRGALRSCGFLGGALGLFATFHEMAAVLAGVVLIFLLVHHARGGPRRAGMALAAVALGYGVGFGPLLARNLAVGAPPLAVSCRTLVDFVEANEAGALQGGASFARPGEAVGPILDAARGSLARAVALVWKSYGGDTGRLLRHGATRFAAIWQWPEAADNTSYYLYRNLTRTLDLLPTFALLFPLGFAGAAAAVALKTWRRAPGGHAVLGACLMAVAGALSLVHTVARFRLFVVPFFWVYGGIFLVLLAGWLRSRRLGAAAAGVGCLLAGAALQRLVPRELTFTAPRPSDYVTASALSLREGDYDLALRVAEDAVRHDPGRGAYFANLAARHERDGHEELALGYYRRALEIEPGLAAAREGSARLLRQERSRIRGSPPSGEKGDSR